MIKSNNDTKENFCGACAAIPLAMVGAGVAGAGGTGNNGKHKKVKTIALWSGIIITLLSVIIAIYFLTRCKDCNKK